MRIGRLTTVLVLVLAASGVLVPSHAAASSSSGWLSGWANRITLSIGQTRVASTLHDFPLLVHLSAYAGTDGADVSTVLRSLGTNDNRRKIAFTSDDGITLLPAEIESWDNVTEQAWIWVKVPTLYADADTIIYLYYDPAQPDNEMIGDVGSHAGQSVWDNGFVGVWHLDRSPDGTFRDSTDRQHDAVEAGAGGGPEEAAGIIDSAQSFNGHNWITADNSEDFSVTGTGQLSISLWISPAVYNFASASEGWVNFMGKGDAGNYEWSFVLYNRDRTNRPQRISFYVDNPKGGLGSGSYSQQPIALDEWVSVTAQVDAGYTYIYRNGQLEGYDPYTGSEAYVDVTPRHGKEPVRIGTRDSGTLFQGRIEEVRISNVARSDAWVQATYYSESDRLVTFGANTGGVPILDRIGERSVIAGDRLSFALEATSPNGSPVAYWAANLPPGASLDSSTGVFSWVPRADQVGAYPNVKFTAASAGLSASENVTLTVYLPSRAGSSGSSIPLGPLLGAVGGLVIAAAALFALTLKIRSRRRGAEN